MRDGGHARFELQAKESELNLFYRQQGMMQHSSFPHKRVRPDRSYVLKRSLRGKET